MTHIIAIYKKEGFVATMITAHTHRMEQRAIHSSLGSRDFLAYLIIKNVTNNDMIPVIIIF